ncbi:YadA C-terminal domain-containing protein, partial [Veillonella magna]|uniref:YadA C-terminal domain-containing protein n=1 Tax=Veillonella magna TaxID=464322 RepID=UPI0023EFC5BB
KWARVAADNKLNDKINTEAVKREAADLKLTGVIGQEISDRKAADVAEKWARVAADKKEADAREAADNQLNSKIVAESWARSAADARLSERIDQSNAALDNETKERKAADTELSNRIHSVSKDVKKVGARAAALAGLHPLDFDETTKFSFAAATGSYKSENSVALGAFYRPNKNVMVSAGSTLGSDAAYNLGISFKFGSETAKTEVNSFSTQQLYAAVAELQRQMAAQQQTIEAQQQEINALKNAQNA